MEQRHAPEVAALIEVLDSGGEPESGALFLVLRRSSCPGELVERLARCRWTLGRPEVLKLLVRHPRCPRHFALESLPRLGWHDLVDVARDPRTAPAVRTQCERKLIERLPSLTLGERTALARVAPRRVIGALLASGDPQCVEALLNNPQFTESEALRLVSSNRNAACLLVLLRHPGWGRRPEIIRAAVRSRAVPVGVAIGLLPALPLTELTGLAAAVDVAPALRAAAECLAGHRRGRGGPPASTAPS
ncbi:MAG: hypothetical protein LAO05_05325 [Acidobacteriia bacterium]|nr:hypothetical protein [Terriglobia bacterium]